MSAHSSLRFTLWDVQIVDAENLPVGRIDDLLVDLSTPGQPRIGDILTGAEALGQRLGGGTGGLMAWVAARLRPTDHPRGPVRLPWSAVASVDGLIHLRAPLRELPAVAGLEHWLSAHLIADVPGADRENE